MRGTFIFLFIAIVFWIIATAFNYFVNIKVLLSAEPVQTHIPAPIFHWKETSKLRWDLCLIIGMVPVEETTIPIVYHDELLVNLAWKSDKNTLDIIAPDDNLLDTTALSEHEVTVLILTVEPYKAILAGVGICNGQTYLNQYEVITNPP